MLEADNDRTGTKSPALQPNENTISGTESTNGNHEKMEHEKGDDDPKKSSEASANKLEMFQEKQKFIEEQNRKRKEMLSKVNLKQEWMIFVNVYLSQAILDRQKQTDQESRKLQIVQVKWKYVVTFVSFFSQFDNKTLPFVMTFVLDCSHSKQYLRKCVEN